MQTLIRTIVSGKHHRLVDEQLHVNLDLSYITPRILATSYPASGLETVYRNSAVDLAKFLHARHPGRHLILNLSERPYSAEPFGERATVLEHGFPDHHAPPLEVAWRSCAAMHAWLLADPENIVVVHCLAGKGRTGVIIACYLILSGCLFEAGEGKVEGEGSSPHPGHAAATFVLPPPQALASQALDVFAQARGEGPKYASQQRIVRYFADLLRTTLLAESTRLQSVPAAAEGAAAAATAAGGAQSTDPDQPTPCLWEAALAMHNLPALPLAAVPTLSLLSCAVGGLHGLDASHPHPHQHHHHFALVINSAPFQGHEQFSFYDSTEGPEEAVTVVQGYELEGTGAGAGAGGGTAAAVAAAAPTAAATEPAAAAGATPAHTSGASWLSSMVSALSSAVGVGGAAPAAAPTLLFSVEHTSLKGDLLIALQSVGPAGHEHPVQVFRAACHSEWQQGQGGACCPGALHTHTHTNTHTHARALTLLPHTATHAAPPLPYQPPFFSRSVSATRTQVCTELSSKRQTWTRASTPGTPFTWTTTSSASSSSALRWTIAAWPQGKSPGPHAQPQNRRHGRMTSPHHFWSKRTCLSYQ